MEKLGHGYTPGTTGQNVNIFTVHTGSHSHSCESMLQKRFLSVKNVRGSAVCKNWKRLKQKICWEKLKCPSATVFSFFAKKYDTPIEKQKE